MGGVDRSGYLLNWAFGINFFNDVDVSGQPELKLFVSFQDETFNLPIPRMMHQSCFVKNSKGFQTLLCIGGKVGLDQASSGYTDSVIGYDCRFLFNPYMRYKQDPENKVKIQWESLANMANQRANFGLCQVENFVYVYGGIQSSGKGKQKHIPTLVNTICEKYDATADKWEKIEIAGAPSLAAFACCPVGKGQIMILGGSDGDLLSEASWIIDFEKKTATEDEETIGNQTAMGKLVYRPKAKKVYHIGGYGSGGQNFVKKLGSSETWEEFERSHVALLGSSVTGQSQEIELVQYSTVYFE